MNNILRITVIFTICTISTTHRLMPAEQLRPTSLQDTQESTDQQQQSEQTRRNPAPQPAGTLISLVKGVVWTVDSVGTLVKHLTAILAMNETAVYFFPSLPYMPGIGRLSTRLTMARIVLMSRLQMGTAVDQAHNALCDTVRKDIQHVKQQITHMDGFLQKKFPVERKRSDSLPTPGILDRGVLELD